MLLSSRLTCYGLGTVFLVIFTALEDSSFKQAFDRGKHACRGKAMASSEVRYAATASQVDPELSHEGVAMRKPCIYHQTKLLTA